MPGTGSTPDRILTPVQRQFLENFFEAESIDFYLSGGTALSGFYLGHRYSDDLDFFTRDSDNIPTCGARIERAAIACGLKIVERQPKSDEFHRFVLSGDGHESHPLRKVELVFDTPPYFGEVQHFGSIRVDDLLAIAVNKLDATSDRFELKDFIDLFFILESGRFELDDLFPLAKEKNVGKDEILMASHLARAGQLPDIGRFIQDYMVAELDVAAMIAYFEDAAKRLFALRPPRFERRPK